MPGHPLILWTIRIALACFAVYFGGVIARQPWASDRRGRRLWTLGCVIFIVHVYFAFKYFHQWSYASAVEHTAKETEAIVGLRFGQGILVSYLFLFVWLGDVVWWWVAADQRNRRPRWAGALLNGFLLFIAFNGAIIFESGVTRPAGIAVCAVYALLAVRSALRPLPTAEPEKVAAS